MRPLDFAVEPGGGGLDVGVADAAVQHVPVEAGLELGAVVGLDRFDSEGEPLEEVVEELDGCFLVVLRIDAQHAYAGAVVNGGELVVLFVGDAWYRGDELHVDLHLVAGLGLLVALPALGVSLVALVGRQPAHAQAVEHSPHPRVGDLDVAVALEVHCDLQRAEVVVLAQIHDLGHHLGAGRPRAVVRLGRAVPEPFFAQLLVAVAPLVEHSPADAVVAARRRHTARHLLRTAKHRQAVPDLALLVSFVHQVFLSRKTPTVNNLRQF